MGVARLHRHSGLRSPRLAVETEQAGGPSRRRRVDSDRPARACENPEPSAQSCVFHARTLGCWCADGGTRTPTGLCPPGPKPGASTNSATPAGRLVEILIVPYVVLLGQLSNPPQGLGNENPKDSPSNRALEVAVDVLGQLSNLKNLADGPEEPNYETRTTTLYVQNQRRLKPEQIRELVDAYKMRCTDRPTHPRVQHPPHNRLETPRSSRSDPKTCNAQAQRRSGQTSS